MLVCAAEALSRLTDHEDRGTAVLFGDGAAAVVVAGGDLELGCGSFVLGSDGEQADLLYAEVGERKLRMQGQAVFRHAVRRMADATARGARPRRASRSPTSTSSSPTRPTARIIEAAAAELGVAPERVVVDVGRVANTSSASIPLALHQAERDGRLRPGMTVALAAFGAGFVWGAGVVGYKERVHACA